MRDLNQLVKFSNPLYTKKEKYFRTSLLNASIVPFYKLNDINLTPFLYYYSEILFSPTRIWLRSFAISISDLIKSSRVLAFCF